MLDDAVRLTESRPGGSCQNFSDDAATLSRSTGWCQVLFYHLLIGEPIDAMNGLPSAGTSLRGVRSQLGRITASEGRQCRVYPSIDRHFDARGADLAPGMLQSPRTRGRERSWKRSTGQLSQTPRQKSLPRALVKLAGHPCPSECGSSLRPSSVSPRVL